MPYNDTVTSAIGRMLKFDKYLAIINQVQNTDVSSDITFRKAFDDYYDVRRNPFWLTQYFDYFQRVKNNKAISFNEIIDYCFNNMKTNKGAKYPVEASFSSKMLATINPNMPILDSKVLSNMGLSIDGTSPQEKLASAKNTYKEICRRYEKYIGTNDCNDAIAIFNTYFPDYIELTDTKKIDCFLWLLSREELIEIGKFGGLI